MSDALPALERGMLPVTPPAVDRLPPMLFLAALFHALVILGVTFDIGLDDAANNSLTLDVVVLTSTDQRIDAPSDAAYLAEVSQSGAGNSAERRPSGAPPIGVDAPALQSELLGDFAPDVDPTELLATPLLATTSIVPDTVETTDDPPEQEPQPRDAAALPSGAAFDLPLPERNEANPELYDTDPRELVFSVDTRESELATYLASWKQRVETEGTRFYNRQQLDSFAAAASPIIEVAIDADGALAEIIVVRSSGNGTVDQAALTVLRQASPYPPIPGHLRSDYDSLRFRYRFEFARAD